MKEDRYHKHRLANHVLHPETLMLGYGYDPLLPYGVEPTGHAWLHSRCWEAWHAARKSEAAAALKVMRVEGRPQRNER